MGVWNAGQKQGLKLPGNGRKHEGILSEIYRPQGNIASKNMRRWKAIMSF